MLAVSRFVLLECLPIKFSTCFCSFRLGDPHLYAAICPCSFLKCVTLSIHLSHARVCLGFLFQKGPFTILNPLFRIVPTAAA